MRRQNARGRLFLLVADVYEIAHGQEDSRVNRDM